MKNKKFMIAIAIAVVLIALGIIAYSYRGGPDEKELISNRDAILEYIKKNRSSDSAIFNNLNTVQPH